MFQFLKVLVQLVDNNIQDNLLSSVHSILKVLKTFLLSDPSSKIQKND